MAERGHMMISLLIPCSGRSIPCFGADFSLFGIVREFARKVLEWLRDLNTGIVKTAANSANSLLFSLFSGNFADPRQPPVETTSRLSGFRHHGEQPRHHGARRIGERVEHSEVIGAGDRLVAGGG